MGSRKPSARAKRVAQFRESLGSLDDVFAREEKESSRREREREQALERKGCTSKQRYAFRSEAEEAIELCAEHGTKGLRCYKCSYCGGWHLTSRPQH